MPELADFHFLRPAWLIALLPLLALPWFLARQQHTASDWSRFIDPALLPHILTQTPASSLIQKQLFLFTGALLAVLALAGPTLERLPTPAFRNIQALIIVLDLSPAMDANDLKPNRLERARYKIINLLQRHRDGQHALVVYSGEAFTVTPLTDDVTTITAQMNALTTGLLPVPGQRVDKGLDQALKLLKQAGIAHGDVLLVTAGGLEPMPPEVADSVTHAGHRLSVLGIGTTTGAPIPLAEGGFHRNAKGEIVVARLDTASLSALASQGNGIYHDMTDDDRDLQTLLDFVGSNMQIENRTDGTTEVQQWRELGPWLLLPLLPLAALAFRRGWLGVWLLSCVLLHPEPASALSWDTLWQTPDQRGQEALTAGKAAEAASLFEHPEWKAAADYQAGHYAESAEILKQQDTARSRYNLGNALAQQGQYAEALKAYDRALELKPDDADARYNRDLVEKALKEQPSSQKPQQQPEQQASDPSSTQNPGSDASEPEQQARKDASPESSGSPETPSSSPEKSPDSSRTKDAAQAEAPDTANLPGQQANPQSTRQAENRQADEQWLRRIPDDPGGLLRRKFYYQYQQRLQER